MATLNIFTTETITEILNNNTNNFIEDFDQPTKKKGKEKIPLSVKNTLWSIYFQTNLNGTCQCCKIENISKNNFDCGHIKSEKDGGLVELSNLRPICRACNSSMGTLNMETFMKKYGFDKIQELNIESKKVDVKEVNLKDDNIKENAKFEKQIKDANNMANTLHKDYELIIERSKKLQNEYMLIFNQLLLKCKNDDLKNICEQVKMQKTTNKNKEEYMKEISQFLNEKVMNDYNDISKCHNCNKKFNTKQHLENHINKKKKCNEKTDYHCKDCNKYFNSIYYLKQHNDKCSEYNNSCKINNNITELKNAISFSLILMKVMKINY